METIYIIECQDSLAKIISGELPPNGQECHVYKLRDSLAFSHKFYVRYDNIFDIGFIGENGTEHRSMDKITSLTEAVKGND